MNHKLIFRLYQKEGLSIHRRWGPRRHRSTQTRERCPVVCECHKDGSMDFMSGQLFSGHRFRLSTLVDNFSLESLAVEPGQRLTGDDVVSILEQVCAI